MKLIKFAGLFCLSVLLFQSGMFALGVPADLPTWRWIAGIGSLAGSILIANHAWRDDN